MSDFSNEFGSVHTDRISFYAKKSWFGGGILEDLPIRHVTSVRIETTRKPIWGGILVLLGLGSMAQGSLGGIVVGLVFVALGAVLIAGWPTITINTAGNDLRKASGTLFQKDAAEDFTKAVKAALFAKP